MSASQSEPVDQALSLLSVAIGAIMEDEEVAAVSTLPPGADKRRARIAALGLAGRDIAALAAAAEVLLRRGENL